MFQKPKKNGQTEAQSDSIDLSVGEATELNPKENEQTEGRPEVKNLSAGDAAKLMQGAVYGMRQLWLQNAVTLANAFKIGQSVSQGSIEDLRRLRENYEELEGARLQLQNLRPLARPVVEAETAFCKGDVNEDALEREHAASV